jgi:hypothetical protein
MEEGISRAELTTHAIALPIHLGRESDAGLVQGEGAIHGTAFPVGGNFFLTAGHVVHELNASSAAGGGVPALGIFHPRTFRQSGIRISDAEILGNDIGLLQVRFDLAEQESWIFPLYWDPFTHTLGEAVRSPGFAYGDHRVGEARYIVQRSFQGSVVADIGIYLPVGHAGNPFGVFELSFAAPRGHSGAPLLRADGRVMGVVIGNSKSRMLVLDSEEIDESSGARTILQQYESLSLGIAVRAADVFALRSRMLGKTIGQFVADSGRAIGYDPSAAQDR